eukprot:322196-Chlamydomonas_euryale.AAC.4
MQQRASEAADAAGGAAAGGAPAGGGLLRTELPKAVGTAHHLGGATGQGREVSSYRAPPGTGQGTNWRCGLFQSLQGGTASSSRFRAGAAVTGQGGASSERAEGGSQHIGHARDHVAAALRYFKTDLTQL